MDADTEAQVRQARDAITAALSGIITFLATLKPTLRNEILQILGDKIDQARLAKEQLDALLGDVPPPPPETREG